MATSFRVPPSLDPVQPETLVEREGAGAQRLTFDVEVRIRAVEEDRAVRDRAARERNPLVRRVLNEQCAVRADPPRAARAVHVAADRRRPVLETDVTHISVDEPAGEVESPVTENHGAAGARADRAAIVYEPGSIRAGLERQAAPDCLDRAAVLDREIRGAGNADRAAAADGMVLAVLERLRTAGCKERAGHELEHARAVQFGNPIEHVETHEYELLRGDVPVVRDRTFECERVVHDDRRVTHDRIESEAARCRDRRRRVRRQHASGDSDGTAFRALGRHGQVVV